MAQPGAPRPTAGPGAPRATAEPSQPHTAARPQSWRAFEKAPADEGTEHDTAFQAFHEGAPHRTGDHEQPAAAPSRGTGYHPRSGASSPPGTGHPARSAGADAPHTGGYRQRPDVSSPHRRGHHEPPTGAGASQLSGFYQQPVTTGNSSAFHQHIEAAHPEPGLPPRAGGTTGSHDTVIETTGTQRRSPVSPGQTATGTHRAVGKAAGRRRVATWPIVSGVFVLLLVVGLLGWGWANNVLNGRAEAQANSCAEGDATMKVLVTPAAEKPVTAAAARWNQARTVVHAHCIHIDVTSMSSDRALDAMTGRTNLDSIGGLPAAWIAENSYWIGQLQAAEPAMIAAPAESIASARSSDYLFVGLTGSNLDEVQARAAQVFRDYLREPAQQADFTAAGLTSG